MVRLQLTERGKDWILNVLLVVSLSLLIIGVVRPSVPTKKDPSPNAERTVMRLEPIAARQLPEFPVLEEVTDSSSTNSSKNSSPAATASTSVKESPSSPSSNARGVTKRPTQVVNIPQTLNSILKIKLF